jgi:hypothetical protein
MAKKGNLPHPTRTSAQFSHAFSQLYSQFGNGQAWPEVVNTQ